MSVQDDCHHAKRPKPQPGFVAFEQRKNHSTTKRGAHEQRQRETSHRSQVDLRLAGGVVIASPTPRARQTALEQRLRDHVSGGHKEQNDCGVVVDAGGLPSHDCTDRDELAGSRAGPASSRSWRRPSSASGRRGLSVMGKSSLAATRRPCSTAAMPMPRNSVEANLNSSTTQSFGPPPLVPARRLLHTAALRPSQDGRTSPTASSIGNKCRVSHEAARARRPGSRRRDRVHAAAGLGPCNGILRRRNARRARGRREAVVRFW
jgi:hypothetical protein